MKNNKPLVFEQTYLIAFALKSKKEFFNENSMSFYELHHLTRLFEEVFKEKGIYVRIIEMIDVSYYDLNGDIRIHDNHNVDEIIHEFGLITETSQLKKVNFLYDQKFILSLILKVKEQIINEVKTSNFKIENRPKNDTDEMLRLMDEEIKRFEMLKKENPEEAKRQAIIKLQNAGILDDNGELKPPYNGIMVNSNDFTRGPERKLKK